MIVGAWIPANPFLGTWGKVLDEDDGETIYMHFTEEALTVYYTMGVDYGDCFVKLDLEYTLQGGDAVVHTPEEDQTETVLTIEDGMLMDPDHGTMPPSDVDLESLRICPAG